MRRTLLLRLCCLTTSQHYIASAELTMAEQADRSLLGIIHAHCIFMLYVVLYSAGGTCRNMTSQARCRVDLTCLCRRGHGNIINISSVAGLEPMKGFAVYCAAKFGVLSTHTRHARELPYRLL